MDHVNRGCIPNTNIFSTSRHRYTPLTFLHPSYINSVSIYALHKPRHHSHPPSMCNLPPRSKQDSNSPLHRNHQPIRRSLMHNLLDLLKMLLKQPHRALPHQRRRQRAEKLRPNLLPPAADLLVIILRTVIVLALPIMHARVRGIDVDARDRECCAAFSRRVDRDAPGFGRVEEVVGQGDEVQSRRELALARVPRRRRRPRVARPRR